MLLLLPLTRCPEYNIAAGPLVIRLQTSYFAELPQVELEDTSVVSRAQGTARGMVADGNVRLVASLVSVVAFKSSMASILQ